ncbi:MAG: VOC family protein [Balneolaceae bacterium]|nr:VOC family protein [Balneolaceae bacterium]
MEHVISWFEIPATDIKRAKAFYETILDIELISLDMGDEFKMEMFPSEQGAISGAIVMNKEWYKPSASHGPLIYLNGGDDLQVVEDRIAEAGGTVTIPKRQISPEHGYMAVFEDSEGNRMALHSNN